MSSTKMLGCDTCSVAIQGDGIAVHEPTCLRQENERHKEALRKIWHVLREIGLLPLHVAADVIQPGVPK